VIGQFGMDKFGQSFFVPAAGRREDQLDTVGD
jgi:hypothetical protein